MFENVPKSKQPIKYYNIVQFDYHRRRAVSGRRRPII